METTFEEDFEILERILNETQAAEIIIAETVAEVPEPSSEVDVSIVEELFNQPEVVEGTNTVEIPEILINDDLTERINEETVVTAQSIEDAAKLKRQKKAAARKKVKDALNKKIKTITDLAEEIHPDCWDFQKIKSGEFKPSSNVAYRLVIYFDNIEITNSKRNTHTITDLYISAFFNVEMNHVNSLFGHRGKISFAEICSRYRHSHLPKREESYWNQFCLGGGSDLYNNVNGLIADGWNPPLFQTVLIALYGYVAWESLEGGPYHRIGEIKESSNNGSNVSIGMQDIQAAYKKFIATYDTFPSTLVVTDEIKFKVASDNIELETLVTNIVEPRFRVMKGEAGGYTDSIVNRNERVERITRFNSRNQADELKHKIVFKGQIISTCCNEEVTTTQETVLVAHPRFTKYIAEQLELEINNYNLKEQTYESSK